MEATASSTLVRCSDREAKHRRCERSPDFQMCLALACHVVFSCGVLSLADCLFQHDGRMCREVT